MSRHTGGKKTAGGLSKKEKFFEVFNRVRCRTTDPNNKDYKRYGGRGIKCEWTNYLDFKKDMYESYLEHKKTNKTTSLERTDNNGNYCKENCKWITMQEQAKNKRTSRYITFNNEKMIVADWARKLKVHRQSIRYRLEKDWDIESIINVPFNYRNKYDKITKTIRPPKNIYTKKS